MFKTINTLTLILLVSISMKAQKSDSIPFTLTPFNNIYVQTILNNVDTLNLMFHTGENRASITEEALNKIHSSKATTSYEASSWGGKGEGKFFENNRLQIGQSAFDSMTIWVNKYSGRLTDGKFGPRLFQGKIIEINYDNNILIIHSLPIAKKALKGYQKFKLIQENDLLFIKGKLKIGHNFFVQKFMIHTGYGGNILIDDQFAQRHLLGEHLEIIEESFLLDSYGNKIITKKARLPLFKLGKSKLKKISISFFDGAIGRQKISVIGNGLLKKYNSLVDTENGFIYLKPNKYMADA